ncbi:BTAD domain-containing putative transcriptional regulator [Streptomyces yokosukanensis]|uniref:AfsR/SARP family transcriptional regulator n=1 Tax=Streptomyces yokosukanensis TaxID=67386 RepID=UPI00343F1DC6
MEFSVLGPVEVRDGIEDLTLAAAKPRRVLATLLLNAGRVVSHATLIEELWDEEPPRLARKTIQTYLYQLRKALASGPCGEARQWLETRPNGYRLLLQPGELDLHAFQQRVALGRSSLADGDHARAAQLLREALGLWRGDALDDVPHGPVLAAEVARLEETRLAALQQRIEADLRLGLHRELVGELQTLTRRHPLREEFSAQLLLAAHRSGLREEALSCYARLRRAVVEHTGLEPSERLQRLHSAVLADAPALNTPERPAAPRPGHRLIRPAEIPAGIAEIVGRTAETEALERQLARSAALVPLVGAPGTGKTALAVHVAHRVRERFPDGQLFLTLHDGEGRPLEPLAAMRSMLRTIAPGEPPASLEEAARMFRSWTADRRVLVFLDDAASVHQVLQLLPSGQKCATIVTSRRRLAGLPGSGGVRLDRLTAREALALLGTVAGHERVERERGAAAELVAWCEGLPLAVWAAGQRLAARPALGVAELAARMRVERQRLGELQAGDVDVRQRIGAAVRRLGGADERALRTLAALGDRRLDPGELGRTLDLSPERTEALVERFLDAHLMLDGDTEPGVRIPALVRLACLGPTPPAPGAACAQSAALPRTLPDRRLSPRSHRTVPAGSRAHCRTVAYSARG